MIYKLKKININETSLEGMFKKHSEAGYIIISTFRGGDVTDEILRNNLKRNQQLKSDIKSSGFSYTMAWGGWIETDREGNRKPVKEQSFIVFNFKRSDEPEPNDKELKALGLVLTRKYEQDAFLYKPQGEEKKSFTIDGGGNIIDRPSNATPTKAADDYFTSLSKSRSKTKNKTFTFREGKGVIWMAKRPQTLVEAYSRRGEIFFEI